MPVPVVSELSALYNDGSTSRFKMIIEAFREQYGHVPELFARAPGRVNIIGEHIDYSEYGVLPMAIAQDTVVAISRGGTKLVVANVQKDKFPTMEYETNPTQDVDTTNHSWANYFMAGYKGVFEALAGLGHAAPDPVGLQVMVHGIVPTGAGVSSSAAICCSSMLAVFSIYGISLQRHEVAHYAAAAERYVGVQAGGMDQAISMMGMQGVAMYIEFNPVRATEVKLPSGATFVIANSLAVSNKAQGAHTRYNMRVVECRLATVLLAIALGVPRDKAVRLLSLRALEASVANKYGSADKAAEAVLAHLHEARYTQEELEDALGIPLLELFPGSSTAPKCIAAAAKVGGFCLKQRALHVFTEAARVLEFIAVCKSSASSDEKLTKLGQLMDSSHRSCADLYECSCPELETLTALARSAGALGSRLTGAGWGGCTVSLVRDEQVGTFLSTLRDKYFESAIQAGLTTKAQLGECLFASKPSSGAAVLRDLQLI